MGNNGHRARRIPARSNAFTVWTYGILGQKAEALKTLKRAIASGYANLNWIAKDSDFDCLHDDPEFQKLVSLGEPPAL